MVQTPDSQAVDERVVVAKITQPCDCPFRRCTSEFEMCTLLSSGSWVFLCLSDEVFPAACELKKLADTGLTLDKLLP